MTSLRLLGIDFCNVRRTPIVESDFERGQIPEPSAPLEDLRELLDSQPQLHIVFFNEWPSDIAGAAAKLDDMLEWDRCDRWRIAGESSQCKLHPRNVCTSLRASELRGVRGNIWVEELEIEKSEFPEAGHYPLLMRLVFANDEDGAADGLDKWLSASDTPVLSGIEMRSKISDSTTSFAVNGGHDFWTGGEWIVSLEGGGVPSPEFCRMLRMLKGSVRLQDCNLRWGSEIGTVIGDERWQESLETLRVESSEESSSVVDKGPYRFLNLRHLNIDEFDFTSIDQWRCLFSPASLPSLRILEIYSVRKAKHLAGLFRILSGPEFAGLTALHLAGDQLGHVLMRFPIKKQLPNVCLPRLHTFTLDVDGHGILTSSEMWTDRKGKVGMIFEALDAPLRAIRICISPASFENLKPILAKKFADADVNNKRPLWYEDQSSSPDDRKSV